MTLSRLVARHSRRTLLVATLLSVATAPAAAAPLPLKPHEQLVEEVIAFLMSDVGHDGILTMDGDPLGDPVPPYFYHYSIRHNDRLRSATGGYPGYASISYPGYTMAIAIDAFLAWWAYSGDPDALARATFCADWLIPRRTPPGDVYGNWVYSTQTDAVMGGGYDGDAIMSDKPGMFGARCLRLYDITGDTVYLTAATEIADTYVATQLTGGPENDGRWPFRVRPSDGLVRQAYTSHLIPAIRLLESMETRAPGLGYETAAQRAWTWLENNPLNPASLDYMHWEGFYEDIDAASSTGLHDHYSAESTLAALLRRNAPGDISHAIDILTWSTDRYLAPDGIQNGNGAYAPALLEWDAWMNATYAATGQWAYVNLLLDQTTAGTPEHDPQWRPRAIEALHTLTYGQGTEELPADGRMLTTVRELTQPQFGIDTWYEQNFNTVIYMLLSMGIATELAPGDENHLLRSGGGELTDVSYQADRIVTTWSMPGSSAFKLVAQPYSVRIGDAWYATPQAGTPGWSWDAASQMCEVRHLGGDVEIRLGDATAVAHDRPAGLALEEAYPNPFNPTVVIPLRLGEAAEVTVDVLDARGRRVRRLVERTLPAGSHPVVWNGRDDQGEPASSGVYSVIARSAEQSRVRRITLVR